jgi:hypothetical protein
MNIRDWMPMSYWNRAFDIGLDTWEVGVFRDFCLSIVTDYRFTGENASGAAVIHKAGNCNGYFSARFMNVMLGSLKSVPDPLPVFLAAVGEDFEIHGHDEAWAGYERLKKTVKDLGLSGKRLRYQRAVFESLSKTFGYQRISGSDLSTYCDPGLVVAAGEIACRRYDRSHMRLRKPADRSRGG